MKAKTGILAVALCLLFCGSAAAGMVEFPKFKIDIPEGWNVAQDGSTYGFTVADKSAALSVTIDSTDGMDAKGIAQAVSSTLKGSAPVAEGPGFTFTFTSGQAPSEAIVIVPNGSKEFVMLVKTGDHPQLKGMAQSFQPK